MPILPPEPPSTVHDMLIEGFNHAARSTPELADTLLSNDSTGKSLSTPHPVYTLDRSNISPDEYTFDRAEMTGWRCLVLEGASAIASVTANIDEHGNLEFANLVVGPLVSGTMNAIEAAEASADATNLDYNLKYLEIRPLHFAAIWLASTNGASEDDILFPLQSHAPEEIEAFSGQSRSKIAKLLADRANWFFPEPDE